MTPKDAKRQHQGPRRAAVDHRGLAVRLFRDVGVPGNEYGQLAVIAVVRSDFGSCDSTADSLETGPSGGLEMRTQE